LALAGLHYTTTAQSTPPGEISLALSDWADSLEAVQADFHASNGQFAQVLPASAQASARAARGGGGLQPQALEPAVQAVSDGADTATSPLPTPTPPPTGIVCPLDQGSCPAIPELPEGVTLAVNVYEAPSGPGYEIVATYVDDQGQAWRKTINYGPEIWRNADWQIVQGDTE
jgi:hypothetical protein